MKKIHELIKMLMLYIRAQNETASDTTVGDTLLAMLGMIQMHLDVLENPSPQDKDVEVKFFPSEPLYDVYLKDKLPKFMGDTNFDKRGSAYGNLDLIGAVKLLGEYRTDLSLRQRKDFIESLQGDYDYVLVEEEISYDKALELQKKFWNLGVFAVIKPYE